MKKLLAFIVISAMIPCLCACADAGTPDAAEQPPIPVAEPLKASATVKGHDSNEAEEPEEPEDIVFPLIDLSGSYEDSLGNEFIYSYAVPALSAENDEAARLNVKLLSELLPIVSEELESMELGSSLFCERLSYRVCVSGPITSIVASAYYPNDYIDYFTINYNTSTGSEADFEALLDYAGISERQFYSKACAAVSRYYSETIGVFSDSEEYEQLYNQTLEKIVDNEYIPTLFITDSGTLCVIVEIYSPAGDFQAVLALTA